VSSITDRTVLLKSYRSALLLASGPRHLVIAVLGGVTERALEASSCHEDLKGASGTPTSNDHHKIYTALHLSRCSPSGRASRSFNASLDGAHDLRDSPVSAPSDASHSEFLPGAESSRRSASAVVHAEMGKDVWLGEVPD